MKSLYFCFSALNPIAFIKFTFLFLLHFKFTLQFSYFASSLYFSFPTSLQVYTSVYLLRFKFILQFSYFASSLFFSFPISLQVYSSVFLLRFKFILQFSYFASSLYFSFATSLQVYIYFSLQSKVSFCYWCSFFVNI